MVKNKNTQFFENGERNMKNFQFCNLKSYSFLQIALLKNLLRENDGFHSSGSQMSKAITCRS